MEPHLGQVSENPSKPSSNEHWTVFHEDEAGSNLANDPSHFRPKPRPFSVESCPPARGADVLAWEPSTDNIDSASPVVSIEGPNIVPDGKPGQESVPLSLEQDSPRVFLQLDGADWHMAEKESAEDSATGSGEEVQFTKWNIQSGLRRVVQMDRCGRCCGWIGIKVPVFQIRGPLPLSPRCSAGWS